MNQTSSSQAAKPETTDKGLGAHSAGRADEGDAFPPRRISTLPPLDNSEAQESFLRSPSAVLESIGLRVPAALAEHIRSRRSSAPPPPPAQAESAASEPVSAAPEPAASATPAPEPSELKPASSVEPSATPTAIPPARRGKGRAPAKKKKS